MVRKKPGRPLGEIAAAVLDLLISGPRTAREIARELRCPVALIGDTCLRLRVAGRIEVASYRKLHGVNRPVALYKLAAFTHMVAPALDASIVSRALHG